MLTPADGQSGRKPRGRRAWLEESNRVADAAAPCLGGSQPLGRGGLPGTAQGHTGSGSPLSPFLPIGGAAAGQKSQQRPNNTMGLILQIVTTP